MHPLFSLGAYLIQIFDRSGILSRADGLIGLLAQWSTSPALFSAQDKETLDDLLIIFAFKKTYHPLPPHQQCKNLSSKIYIDLEG